MFRLPWSVGIEWISREQANMDVGPLVGRPLEYGDKVQAGGYRDGEKMLTLEYKSKPQSHYV